MVCAGCDTGAESGTYKEKTPMIESEKGTSRKGGDGESVESKLEESFGEGRGVTCKRTVN
jgi:hypothetical protein